jgi:hypothetical protein
MENVMPDLQTELSKVIHAWETPTVQTQPTTPAARSHYFKPTNNVTRRTFDFVRDNPGLPRARINNEMVRLGFNYKSVSALLGEMIRQGLIRNNNDALFVTQAEYTPLKQRVVRKTKPAPAPVVQAVAPKPKRKYVRRNAVAKAAAYEAHENYNPTALDDRVVPHKEFSAEDWVNSLTLKQAKAVYEELHKVFG